MTAAPTKAPIAAMPAFCPRYRPTRLLLRLWACYDAGDQRVPMPRKLVLITEVPRGQLSCRRIPLVGNPTLSRQRTGYGLDAYRVLPVCPSEKVPGCGHTSRPCGPALTLIRLMRAPVAVLNT